MCVFERHHSRKRAENVCVHPGIMFVPLLTGAAADKYPAESFDSFTVDPDCSLSQKPDMSGALQSFRPVEKGLYCSLEPNET